MVLQLCLTWALIERSEESIKHKMPMKNEYEWIQISLVTRNICTTCYINTKRTNIITCCFLCSWLIWSNKWRYMHIITFTHIYKKIGKVKHIYDVCISDMTTWIQITLHSIHENFDTKQILTSHTWKETNGNEMSMQCI